MNIFIVGVGMGDTKYLTKIAEEKIKNADIIVLSRTQNISTEEVNKINDEIIKMNKDAIIISKDWKTTKAEELIPKKFIIRQKDFRRK